MSGGKFFIVLLSAVLLVGMADKAKAQSEEEQRASMARAAAQSDPSTRAIVQDASPSLTLESGTEGTLATGKIGFTADAGKGRLQSLLSFQAAPDNNGEATFLNLDGLSGGTSATLKFTYELFQTVSGSTLETPQQICKVANIARVTDFAKTHSAIGRVTECTEAAIVAGGATLINKLAEKENEALGAMCQEINKKRGVNLLAPPGENRDSIPGYSGTCSQKTLIDLQSRENRILEQAELDKACQEFDKAHSKHTLASCTPEELAKRSVDEAVASKNSEALVAVCQEELVVPDSQLFRTGNNVSSDCRLTTLLDFAFTTDRPAYWYRRILRSLPVKFWYLTLEGTQARKSFKFFDPGENFTAKRVGTESTRVEADGSLFYRGIFYSIGAGREHQFSAAPSQKVCFPRDGSPGALNCVEGALAGPDSEDVDFIRGEIRTLFRPNVGVGLRGIYDTSAKEWELHMLLHFLKSPTDGLNGGIDVEYSTAGLNKTTSNPKGDNFGVRLFVGNKFNLPFLPGQPPSSLNAKN